MLLRSCRGPLLASLLALGVACSSSEEYTHADSRPGTDLARYRTYGFLDAVARNDTAFQYSGASIFDLKQAVARQLDARGLRQTTDHPDLLVNIGLTTEQRTQTRPGYFPTDGAPQYIGQRYYHWQANDIPVSTYRAGTATIDLVDAARKELVWQGTTTAILSRTSSRATKQIAAGVAKVFEQFPVAVKQ